MCGIVLLLAFVFPAAAQMAEYMSTPTSFASAFSSNFSTAPTYAQLTIRGVAVSADGSTVYISNSGTRLLFVVTQPAPPQQLAGDGFQDTAICNNANTNIPYPLYCGRSVDSVIGLQASFYYPQNLFFSAAGSLYVFDVTSIRLVATQSAGSPVTTIVSAAVLQTFYQIASNPLTIWVYFVVDSGGSIFMSSLTSTIIAKLPSGGSSFTVLAGLLGETGTGYTDGTGAAARFYGIAALAIDPNDNLLAFDGWKIRKITPAGTVSTFAGSPLYSDVPVDGIGTSASIPNIITCGSLVVSGSRNSSWALYYLSYPYYIVKVTAAGLVTHSSFTGTYASVFSGSAGPLYFASPINSAYYVRDTQYPLAFSILGVCPPGAYCTSSLNPYTLCAPNSYNPNPGIATPCQLCPAGSYNPSSGGNSSAACLICPSGKLCPSGLDPVSCVATSYCPAGVGVGVLCPVGSYCPANSAINTTCPAGKFCPIGSAAPVNCPPGSYCPAGVGAGVMCPVGSYCPTNSAINIPCPAGQYCPIGSAAPVNCLPGSYCPAGVGAGVMCPVGSYCPANSAINTTCPAGKYCPIGSAAPVNCPPGSYCPAGVGAGVMCPAGSYCPANSAINTTCPAGKYCPIGSAAPLNCPPGTFNPSTGRAAPSDCSSCPAGTTNAIISGAPNNIGAFYGYGYDHLPAATLAGHATINSNNGGSTSCSPCLNATFSNSAGAGACTMCADGQYMSGAPAAGTCTPCPAGTYTNSIAQTISAFSTYISYAVNVPGSVPQYLPGPWNSECVLCPAGTYSPAGPGAAACSSPTLQCPQGSFCPAGSAAPTPCPLNSYSVAASATSSAVCLACPASYVTLSTGSTSCISTGSAAFACPSGTQPRSASPPASAADCVPLTCPSHLAALGSFCVGCGSGAHWRLPALPRWPSLPRPHCHAAAKL